MRNSHPITAQSKMIFPKRAVSLPGICYCSTTVLLISSSEMLPDLSIPWVYQSIPLTIYLIHKPDGDGRKSFPGWGIETEFLTGDRNWLFDGLDELYAQFEALDTYYNKGIGAAQPIKTIALDVEGYTTFQ